MDCGLWTVDCGRGLWTVDCGLWTVNVDCGLWTVDVDCGLLKYIYVKIRLFLHLPGILIGKQPTGLV